MAKIFPSSFFKALHTECDRLHAKAQFQPIRAMGPTEMETDSFSFFDTLYIVSRECGMAIYVNFSSESD